MRLARNIAIRFTAVMVCVISMLLSAALRDGDRDRNEHQRHAPIQDPLTTRPSSPHGLGASGYSQGS